MSRFFLRKHNDKVEECDSVSVLNEDGIAVSDPNIAMQITTLNNQIQVAKDNINRLQKQITVLQAKDAQLTLNKSKTEQNKANQNNKENDKQTTTIKTEVTSNGSTTTAENKNEAYNESIEYKKRRENRFVKRLDESK